MSATAELCWQCRIIKFNYERVNATRSGTRSYNFFMLIIDEIVISASHCCWCCGWKENSEWVRRGRERGLTWQSLKLELLVIIISLLYIADHRSIDSSNSSRVTKYNGIKGKINKWEATCKSSYDSSYRLNRTITNTSH